MKWCYNNLFFFSSAGTPYSSPQYRETPLIRLMPGLMP